MLIVRDRAVCAFVFQGTVEAGGTMGLHPISYTFPLVSVIGVSTPTIRRSTHSLPGMSWLSRWRSWPVVRDRRPVVSFAAARSNLAIDTAVVASVLARFVRLRHFDFLEWFERTRVIDVRDATTGGTIAGVTCVSRRQTLSGVEPARSVRRSAIPPPGLSIQLTSAT